MIRYVKEGTDAFDDPFPDRRAQAEVEGHSRAWETGLPAFMPMQDSALENGDLGRS